eukprot:2567154-Pyramimonas_sp.AAC.1
MQRQESQEGPRASLSRQEKRETPARRRRPTHPLELGRPRPPSAALPLRRPPPGERHSAAR